MAGVALAFAVLEISDSASALGWVLAAWTSRWSCSCCWAAPSPTGCRGRSCSAGCNLAQGLAGAVMAGLILTDHAEVWHLAALQSITGTVFAVSYPAFYGMVPILLPLEERKSAFLLISQAASG